MLNLLSSIYNWSSFVFCAPSVIFYLLSSGFFTMNLVSSLFCLLASVFYLPSCMVYRLSICICHDLYVFYLLSSIFDRLPSIIYLLCSLLSSSFDMWLFSFYLQLIPISPTKVGQEVWRLGVGGGGSNTSYTFHTLYPFYTLDT